MNKLSFKYIFLVAVSFLLLTACDDDDKTQQSHLFRPITIDVEPTSEQIVFKWKNFDAEYQETVKGYEISISETEDFNTVVVSEIVEQPIFTLTSGEVLTNSEVYDYYVRVKILSGVNGTGDSKYTMPILFNPYRENIFHTVGPENLSKDYVILKWDADAGSTTNEAEVTKIVIETLDGIKTEYAISDIEKESKTKQIDGLTAETPYIAYIYDGNKRRGRVEFSTRSENEMIVSPEDDLQEIITNAQLGWILRLKAGDYNFSSSTISITKSITLEAYSTKEDEIPSVSVGKFALRGTIGKFSMNGIKFSGNGTISDFIEFSKEDATNGIPAFQSIDTLQIENCKIENFSKSFMIYSSTEANISIKNILINNSIVHDVNANGTAGAQAIDIRNYTANNISITNSTFYNLGRSLLRVKEGTADQKFVLSNCTFYNFSPGSQFFVDFGNIKLNGGSYTIKNNIFAQITTVNSSKGYRIGNVDSSISSEYSYNNDNDFIWPGGSNNPSSGWGEKRNNLSLSPDFKSPTTGDFTLPAGSPLRKAASNGSTLGDPRWGK